MDKIAPSLLSNKGGRAKLVLVTPEKDVIVLAENIDNSVSEDLECQAFTFHTGRYSIKLVGAEKPSLDLVLRVEP